MACLPDCPNAGRRAWPEKGKCERVHTSADFCGLAPYARDMTAENGPESPPPENVIGKYHGVVADAGQERGVHLRQPLQAEEIQARHRRDAVAMHRLAFGIGDREIDPAEIDAVAGGPDH